MPTPIGVVRARTNLTANQIKALISRIMGRAGGAFTPAAEQQMRTELAGTPPFQTREVVPMQKQIPETPLRQGFRLPLPEAQPQYFAEPREWQLPPTSPIPTTILGTVPPGSPMETAAGISYRTEKEVPLTSQTLLRVLKQKLSQYPEIPGKSVAAAVIEGVGAWREYVAGLSLQRGLWRKLGPKRALQEKFLSLYADSQLQSEMPQGLGPEEARQLEFVKNTQQVYPVEKVSPTLTPEELTTTLERFLGRPK